MITNITLSYRYIRVSPINMEWVYTQPVFDIFKFAYRHLLASHHYASHHHASHHYASHHYASHHYASHHYASHHYLRARLISIFQLL
jgi:hypothetical protein